jgi:hypothetical protein
MIQIQAKQSLQEVQMTAGRNGKKIGQTLKKTQQSAFVNAHKEPSFQKKIPD